MTPLPRILTVDPTSRAAELTRAALRLLERPAIQVNVPGGVEAFDEIEHGHLRLILATYDLGGLSGLELALRARQRQPETSIVLLAGPQDEIPADELALSGPENAGLIVLREPIEPHQLLRVFSAALDGRDITAAAFTTSNGSGPTSGAMPQVPDLDLNAASRVLDSALTDVGAMAVVLSARTGEVLLERGAVGYIDREQITNALAPTVNATIDMTRIIGGRPTALLYYDGDHYDVFVLSAGLHHFLILVFDGQSGLRSYGAVNRYGRRATEDLIALIGASALILEAPAPVALPPEIEEPVVDDIATGPLEPAELPPAPQSPKRKTSTRTAAAVTEPEAEPAADFDASILLSLFNAADLAALEGHALDDLFNPERLAEIANETRSESGPLSYEEARELGLIP